MPCMASAGSAPCQRPRLLTRARLFRHRYRGRVWYLLQDPASSRVHLDPFHWRQVNHQTGIARTMPGYAVAAAAHG